MTTSIIFDIGGVLAYDVWEHMLFDKKEGLVSTHKLDKQRISQVGGLLWEQFAHAGSSDWRQSEIDYWTQFNKLSGNEIPMSEIIQITEKFIKPVAGMTNLLEFLMAQNIQLAICSNNTEFWFHRQSQKLGLGKYIPLERIILSYKIGVSKSSPRFEMFEKVMQSLDVAKSECIFIDDRIESISRAIEFGLPSVLFPSHAENGSQYLRLLLVAMNIISN